MTVAIYKLVTSEEVIGRSVRNIATASQPGTVVLESPRVMQMMQTAQGVGAALVPWILTNPDATVTIKAEHIISEIACPVDVERSYLQQISKLDLTSSIQV